MIGSQRTFMFKEDGDFHSALIEGKKYHQKIERTHRGSSRAGERLAPEPVHLDTDFEPWDIVRITGFTERSYPDYTKLVGRVGVLQQTLGRDYPDTIILNGEGESLPFAFVTVRRVVEPEGKEDIHKKKMVKRIEEIFQTLGYDFSGFDGYYPD